MNKRLINSAVYALAAMLLIPVSYASANDDNGVFPHIDGNSQFPQTRVSNVRHTFEVHIPKNSKSVSHIFIQVPEVVKWSSKAKNVVVNGNGKKVNANVTIHEKTITLAFAEPVVPDTHLSIDINNVRRVTLGNGSVYRLSTKFESSEITMPIGVVRFRIQG
ncbi:hypothetical protein NIES4071_65760 [Calothrix sp. NIES-4071]|nr:hypothetical protein NIES4071_65760 [Calothrix sp. NIES-4071]BAZ60880.1 hypothetical protein NIES4105_65720 [Calothrix sp. NIES-4105]